MANHFESQCFFQLMRMVSILLWVKVKVEVM